MKKLALGLVLAVLLLAIPTAVFAQTENWEGQVHKGDFSAFVGLGIGYGFTIAPGVEWVWGDWKLGDVFPLAAGAAVKGAVNFYGDFWSAYGVAGFVTFHVGLKGLDIPEILQKLDFYAGFGLGAYYYAWKSFYSALDNEFTIGFAQTSGTSFYINDKLAVYGEYNYWGYSRGVVGILFRF